MEKKNEILETICCSLLILMVALEFTYSNRSILSVMVLLTSIGVFSFLTFLSINMEKNYVVVKCESMLLCFTMLIHLLCKINLSILLALLICAILLTLSHPIKKVHEAEISE